MGQPKQLPQLQVVLWQLSLQNTSVHTIFPPLSTEAGGWKLVSRAATDRLPRGGGAAYWELIAAHYFTILPANKQAFCRSAFRHGSRHSQKNYVVWGAQGHPTGWQIVESKDTESSPSALSPQQRHAYDEQLLISPVYATKQRHKSDDDDDDDDAVPPWLPPMILQGGRHYHHLAVMMMLQAIPTNSQQLFSCAGKSLAAMFDCLWQGRDVDVDADAMLMRLGYFSFDSGNCSWPDCISSGCSSSVLLPSIATM